jgi:hypothetical protein
MRVIILHDNHYIFMWSTEHGRSLGLCNWIECRSKHNIIKHQSATQNCMCGCYKFDATRFSIILPSLDHVFLINHFTFAVNNFQLHVHITLITLMQKFQFAHLHPEIHRNHVWLSISRSAIPIGLVKVYEPTHSRKKYFCFCSVTSHVIRTQR